jgi:3-hydroxyisobutyrate dehydrogenase
VAEIGFIGLGNMGGALVRRLMREHRLHVWDLNPDAVEALVKEGAIAANGPAGVGAAGTDLVLTCLPTSAQVEEVLFGDGGVAEALADGALIADMTTGDPLATKDMAARLAERGIDLIDAPVSGGVVGAEQGTIAIMIGAPDALFERVRPMFEAISPNIFHAGDTGAGHAMKLINNMISSCVRLATFEGLVLAVKAGIEPMRFSEILSKGSGRGYVADTTLPKYVIPGRLDQDFGLGLMHKDLTLATKLGQDMKTPLMTGGFAREMFRLALNELGEEVDITQLIRVFERAAGVDVCAAYKPG